MLMVFFTECKKFVAKALVKRRLKDYRKCIIFKKCNDFRKKLLKNIPMIRRLIKTTLLLPLRVCHFVFSAYDKVISSIFPQLKGVGRQQVIDYIDNDVKLTEHGTARFYLYTPNQICNFRHSTFSTKEPEMLEWIEEYGDGVFFDIGANIGIYSLFYAQTKQGSVYSFEPSVFNLRQLAKNISINKLSERITIISNPLTDSTGIASFINGSADEGGALSAFGVEYGQNGKPINSDINYSVVGFSLDDLFETNILIETPSLIKIDVDGIEHLILKGAPKTLNSKTLKSLFIEVNDDFKEQAYQVKTILESAGFTLKEKRHSEKVDRSTHLGQTYNQIWVRN
jgi:FkbM family methyltransferase